MRKISILLVIISIYGCGVESTENEEQLIVPDETILVDTLSEIQEEIEPELEEIVAFELNIDSFSEFPKEIDGCACYFSKTLDAFKQGNYFYMDDFGQEIAFMKLNGEMTKFSLTASNSADDESANVVGANKDYVITIKMNEVSSLDETFQKEGEVIINNSIGQTISIPFFGECGC